MNPHTYRRNHVSGQPSLGRVILETFVSTPISSAVAFAMIIFAAGSVMAATGLAVPEIAMAGIADPSVQLAQAHHMGMSQVLGDSTTTPSIDDSSLEAADPVAELSFKPVSFNSNGRWDYKIGYRVSNLTGSGQINIGTFVLAQNISASGTVETGAILKPNTVYHVSVWVTDSSGGKEKIQSQVLHTAKATTKPRPCDNDSLLCPPIGIRPCIYGSVSSTSPTSLIKCPPIVPCLTNSTSTSNSSGVKINCLPVPCLKNSEHPCLPPVCPPGQACPDASSTNPSLQIHNKD